MQKTESKSCMLERIHRLHIGSERDAEATRHISRLLAKDELDNLLPTAKRFTKTGETRGFMMVGAPGSGKSHMLNRALLKLDVLAAPEGGVARYIQCSVPSPATFKSMILALLREAGYPDANPRREGWSLVQDLRHRLSLLEISVIWIDEAHDLFCADRKLILRALKSLMQGADPVAIVLSGTEDLAGVIRSDPQVQRRFTAMVLPALVEQVDGEDFATIIQQFCSRTRLAEPTNKDIVGRIFHASRYRFGRAIELLLEAIELALNEDSNCLTRDHFATVYAMNEACSASENVFYAEHYWLIDPDAEADAARSYFAKSGKGTL